MATITLFGASGMIGRRILAEALDRGHHITAVVRDPARIDEQHDNLTVIAGDVTSPDLVAKVVTGADVVISAVAAPRLPGADKSRFLTTAVASLTEGLRTHGDTAPYLITVGGAGTLHVAPELRLIDTPAFPDAVRPEAQAHADMLAYLTGITDVRWTNLAPAAQTGPGERTGRYRLGGDQLLKDTDGASRISAEDYAVAVVDEAENQAHSGARSGVAY